MGPPHDAGKTWQVKVRGNSPDESFTDNLACEVFEETVTVPAGTFDTFRVDCKVHRDYGGNRIDRRWFDRARRFPVKGDTGWGKTELTKLILPN